MKKEDIKVKLNKIFTNKLLLVLFAIYIINKHFVYSVLNYNEVFLIIRKTILYTVYAVLIIKLLVDFIINQKRIRITWIGLIALSILISIITKDLELSVLMLIVLSLREIDFKSIVKTCFYSNLISMLLIISLSLLGIIENWVYKIGTQTQNSLGYNYSTIPSTYLFLLVLMRFYINKANVKIYEIITNIFLSVIMYYYTSSITGSLLIIIISILEIIYKVLKANNENRLRKIVEKKTTKRVLKVIPVFLIAISLYSAFSYNENCETWKRINTILSHRIELSNTAIKTYGIPVLGKDINWVGNGGREHVQLSSYEYNFVDNAYMRIIFDDGIVYFILLVLMLIYYQNRLIKEKKYRAIAIEIVLMIWAVVEPNILKVENNIFLIPFLVTTLNEFKIKSIRKKNEEICN